MKLLSKALIISAIFVSSYDSKAQVTTAKPNLFDAYNSTINCPKSELDKIFTTAEGNVLKLSLGNNFQFTGVVSSSIHRYTNLQSVTIKSNKSDGLVLGISKRINDDKSYTYIGRIINQKYGDAFELKSDNAGNYFLNKIKTDDLIEDHE
ncbi:MAG: hypothetical protein ABJA57_08715 [Ginsengibacter sp.]